MKTPVLFLIFNRPQLTIKVFDEIRKAKPYKLFIAADGPRQGNKEDIENCNEARKIAEMVDWHCEVKTLFRQTNLGCKTAVSSAIDWFFENVEEGIILEDDCLPCQSFFTFCHELLYRYRDNEKIMHISGTNFLSGETALTNSYYFSKYPLIWGWASWRRAWKHYDVTMLSFKQFRDNENNKLALYSSAEKKYWLKKFAETAEGKINTWDYQWVYCLHNLPGISIIPSLNLVSNIGIGIDQTHENRMEFFNAKTYSITKLSHPKKIKINRKADANLFSFFFNPRDENFLEQLKRVIYRRFLQWLKNTYKSLSNTNT